MNVGRSDRPSFVIDPDRETVNRSASGMLASVVLALTTGYRIHTGPFSLRLGLIVLGSFACIAAFVFVIDAIVKELGRPGEVRHWQILVWCMFTIAFGAYLVLVEGCWRGATMLAGSANAFTWQGLAYSVTCAVVGLVMMRSAYQLAFRPRSIGGAIFFVDR